MELEESNWTSSIEIASDISNSTLLFFNSNGIDPELTTPTIYNDPTAIQIIHQSQFSEPFKLLLHILYNLILVCGVVGNGLVLYVIYSLPRMRTTTNYLLANLALGDLIIASFCVPFTYISIVYQNWPFGRILCKLVSPFNAIGVLVSAFTLIALAIEKYVAILHPLAPRLRKSKAVWVVGAIWILAIITTTPIAVVSDTILLSPNSSLNISVPICSEFWGNDDHELYYSISLMMVQYFIPLGVLLFTYLRITFVVWGIQHDSTGHGEINLNRNSKADKRSRKAVILTLAVVCGYTLAWLPYNVNYIISRHNPTLTNEYISIACHWLAMSHSFYNPMIYAFLNNNFRNAFSDVYRKILCCVKTQAANGMSASRCRDRGSFTSTMSTVRRNSNTVRWKSYRKISFTPEPTNNVKTIRMKEDLSVIKEET